VKSSRPITRLGYAAGAMNVKHKCPECGEEMEENRKLFPGLFKCVKPDCDGLHLTQEGSDEFDKACYEEWVKRNMEQN